MAKSRFFRLWPWAAVILLLSTLFWAGWYAYDKGFGRRWRTALAKEFERFGLTVSARRLTLDPFHGLVAKDVEILGGPQRQNVLAAISQISLDINYANLFTHEQALNEVDLQDAQIAIPLDSGDSRSSQLAIKNLHARIYFFPGRIDVRQVTGDLYGIRLTASGTLVNPNQLRPELSFGQVTNEPNYRAAMHFAEKVIDELRSLKLDDEPPQLGFTFQADLNDLGSFRIQNGRLTAPSFSKTGYALSSLVGNFILENRRVDLVGLQVRDAHGELFAKANWDFATGEKQFQVRSSLDLARLLSAEPRCLWARDFGFETPPEIELAGLTTAAGKSQYFGRLNFDRFSYRSVPFQSLKAEFSRAGDSWMIYNAEATHSSGTISGDVLHVPGDFRVRLNSALNPTGLAPLLPAAAQSALANWDFQTAPVIQASLAGARPSFEQLSGTGRAFLGRTRFRGQFINSASANFSLRNNAIDCREVRVNRDEGVGTGGFLYNFQSGEITLTDVQTALSPDVLLHWVAPTLERGIQPLICTSPPTIRAHGTTQFSSAARNDLTIEASFPTAFDYQIGGYLLHFDSAETRLNLLPGRLELTSFKGKIGDGSFSIASTIRLPLTRKTFQMTMNLDRVPVDRAFPTLKFLPAETSWLSGEIRARNRGSEFFLPHLEGSLTLSPLKLEDYRVFASVLDRFQDLGFKGLATASLEFHTDRLALQIDSFRLSSAARELQMSGFLSWLDGELSAQGQIEGSGYHLKAEGPLNHLVWEMSSTEAR
jgi:hypothetical protein